MQKAKVSLKEELVVMSAKTDKLLKKCEFKKLHRNVTREYLAAECRKAASIGKNSTIIFDYGKQKLYWDEAITKNDIQDFADKENLKCEFRILGGIEAAELSWQI